jgi:hypothetical protein
MKQVIKYQCEYCGGLFDTEMVCVDHEDRHKRVDLANQMLDNGSTLAEIQDECCIWYRMPEHLMNVTKDNCFVVSYWQCCDKPAYRIVCINMDRSVKLWGCGSRDGYYGSNVRLDSSCLNNPRPKEELFVDKRYSESIW